MAAKAKKEKESSGAKKSPLPIIIGVVALVIGLLVGRSVLGGAKTPTKADKKASKEVAEEVGISLPLDEFLVNLSGGGDHYLRTTIALGLKKGLTEEHSKEHVAPMRDAILSVLSAKTLKELNSSKGREEMKAELKTRINEAAGDETVVKVYFTAFATQ